LAHASNLSIIRDSEVENVLTNMAKHIFIAAGLNPQNAKIVLVNDDSINAFVAGGQTIFVHSGLITHAKSPDEVAFVLSHETGHIVGGHVIRGTEQMKSAQTTALISTVLGGLLAVAGGSPEAGLAIMMGSNSSVMNSFMAYRQSEESAADRTAVDIMKKTGYSMQGFTDTMKELQRQERLSSAYDNAYWQTHPMTRDRMRDIERFTHNARPISKDEQFDLMRAKLIGFLFPPEQTRHLYQGNSLADKYARAIALYKNNKITDSLKAVEDLIALRPQNAYFYELKGQFLFETGKLNESIPAYEQAVELMPNAPLIRLALGQVLTESDNENDLKKAIYHLSEVVLQDKLIPGAWRLLATAYGKMKNMPMADYAMAEFYMLVDKKDEAKAYYAKMLEVDSANILAHEQLIDLYANEDKFKYYLLRGNLHALQQLMSHAKNDYKKAIEHAKDSVEALPARYLHAGICEEQGKIQEAIDDYLRISDDDENNPLVFIKLAELYEKSEGIIASIEILER
ncbi:MAG: M48 family metalloprotease, partial [Alphaproteobacteria bacterium]|nr:M48 family metalloprotease [Alphaproteobacteria bacterium]